MTTYKNSKIKYASKAQRGDENEVFIDSIKAREILDYNPPTTRQGIVKQFFNEDLLKCKIIELNL